LLRLKFNKCFSRFLFGFYRLERIFQTEFFDIIRTMRIKVLYFAEAYKILNRKEEEIEISESSIAEFLNKLRKLHPEISEILNQSMVAVNLEYRPVDYALKDGDTVAIIPPVEGG